MRPRLALALASLAVLLTGAAPSAQMVADRVPLTFNVIHLHNGGECRGTFTIDKWKFVYTSTDRPQDSRTWKVTDLKEVESKTPDQLILRSTESGKATLGMDKNYKFKVLGAGIEHDVVAWMNDRVK
jgi:hypothetical protein